MANIFEKKDPFLYSLKDINNVQEGRRNLGEEMPVGVYRLFQYSLRNILTQMLGKDMMVEIFREAGRAAG